ncbi:MAG: methyltransferase domain-containing protein [Bacteroidetes bacterium]|nr:methyltransferase domain-containing protein [Bacteroidota bacterium]
MRGRLLAKRLKLNPSEKNYINLGSGALRYKGFINVDFFGGKETGVDYGADLRYPLLIDDNSLDGIFCEHTLEHLTYKNVDQLLAECYRILKPGGTMRIIVPDVSLFVENYAKNNKEWFDRWEYLMFTSSTDSERSKRKLVSKMSAISFVTQEYLHVACWDYETMHHYLVKNKFREIKKSAYRQSVDPMLNIDLDDAERRYVSLHMDAVK